MTDILMWIELRCNAKPKPFFSLEELEKRVKLEPNALHTFHLHIEDEDGIAIMNDTDKPFEIYVNPV